MVNRGRTLLTAAVVLAALSQFVAPAAAATWWAFDRGPLAQHPRDVLTEPAASGAVRVYGDHPGQDATAAARDTVDELVDAGGLERGIVLVTLPTGSGWVDPVQVEAVEDWADGDVANVAVRYARTPSAGAYLRRPALAEQAATALLREVTERVEELDAARRPAVVVQGQSLGVGAGLAAVRQLAQDGAAAPAAQLWQGRPGTVAAPAEDRCTVDEINDDDPVAALGPGLLLDPVAAVGVLADLPGSASSTAGTRHSYRPVLPPQGCVGDQSPDTSPDTSPNTSPRKASWSATTASKSAPE
ncbi:MAG: alpha/beta-hydrolase family protein [Corynebacterium sp.]|nr:alpha/beta-hydrolase family protein [Corynebacterium sp.]